MSRLDGDEIQASAKFLKKRKKKKSVLVNLPAKLYGCPLASPCLCLCLRLSLYMLPLLFEKAIVNLSMSLPFCCRLGDLGEFQLNNLIFDSTGVIFWLAE